MDPDTSGLIVSHLGLSLSLLIVLVLTLLHALFTAAEFLIISGRGAVLQETEINLQSSTYKAISYIEKLNVSLPAVQFGLSLTALAVGWLCAEFFSIFYKTINHINLFLPFFVFILSISLIHAIIGGLVSKTIAIQFPNNTVSMLAVPISFFLKLFYPASYIIRKFTNKLLKIWNTKIPETIPRIQSTEDISVLVSQGTKRGLIDKQKENMFKGVVGFSDTVAREVMTARTDVVSIFVGSTLNEIVEIVKEHSYPRYPVHDTNADDIIGFLLSKDLLNFLSTPGNNEANFRLNKIIREPYFIPGSKPIDSLLSEFRQRKLHIAIVLDEHGGVDGLVTLEDLLEEIVGDIYDESDSHDHDIQQLDDGSLIVDGGVLVADLNEKFPINIPEGDYDTIAGFIFNFMHKMPREGEKVELEHYDIIAQKVVAHRIESIKIMRKNLNP